MGGWQRLSSHASEADALAALQDMIVRVRFAPASQELRRELRAIASLPNVRERAIGVLASEVRQAMVDAPPAAAALLDVLVRCYELLDLPVDTVTAMEQLVALEPNNVEHLTSLATRCASLGAWTKAAEAYERVGALGSKDQACSALRAAAKLYREHSQPDRALAAYNAILGHRPTDRDAWQNLEELLEQLGRWRELADVRGELAKRAASPVDKVRQLRRQARALEQAGDMVGAAEAMASAARYLDDDISGLLDFADVLARSGKAREAADVLGARAAEAAARQAPREEIAGLRARQAALLEDGCGDREAAAAVLDVLLADCPEHVPALERRVWHASHDPDPRVHAVALERYASAIDDPSVKAGSYAEAARRYRDARDHQASARALGQALELAPHDRALQAEREALRATIDADAKIARADELIAANQLDEARELLQQALATAPDGMPRARLAPLALKYAQLVAATGATDEAHRLFHEAHLLDRHSLPIALALGESCFNRKLWRQAILHLAPLADHPDAPHHAARVADGLVLAGQAEARALRPANALKHYEAAIRLDPASPTAWHELGAAAMERGDTTRAVECFEREANGAKQQSDRDRLLAALGDLAHDVLHDAERAERYWKQVAHADAATLRKLLALQRERGADVDLAETCVRLAARDSAQHGALMLEAAEQFSAVGDFVRARSAAENAITAHPLDIDVVTRACDVVLAACDADAAAAWLQRAVDARRTSRTPEPREAELWRRLGDAERSRQHPGDARAAYERAIATASSADSPDGLAARRALFELTPKTARTIDSLEALVELDPAPDEVLALARALAKTDRTDDTRAVYELAVALDIAITDDDERVLLQTAPRAIGYDEAYGGRLDDEARHEVIDDPGDALLGGLLDLLGEAMSLVAPDPTRALRKAGIAEATRLSVSSTSAFVALYPQVSKALGGAPALLFTSAELDNEIRVLLSSPPAIVVGSAITAIHGAQPAATIDHLRFICGRVVELTRPRRMFAAQGSPEDFALIVDALWHAYGPRVEAAPTANVAEEAKRIHSALPIALRRRVGELIGEVPRASVDAAAYIAACQRAADRCGLVACGSILTAIEVCTEPAPHLTRFAASRGYRRARRAVRLHR